MRKILFVLVAMMLVFGVSSCKSTPTNALEDLYAGAPEWVIKGSGAFGGDQGKIFYGVGSAKGIPDMSLLRSTSANRARNEIAKVFSVFTASLMKDYSASTTSGTEGAASFEQNVEQAIKTVTAQTLNGVQIVDSWWSSKTGEMFTLARLDLDGFKDAIAKQKELDNRVKEYIKKNADRMHDQLDKEIEKAESKGQ